MSRRWLGAAALLAAGAWLSRRVRTEASLEGDVALVTGGSRGLGYLLAERLLRQGCRVAICARDEEALERARERLSRETGGEVLAVPCDVADHVAVEAMVAEVVRRMGWLDLLINNGAVIQVAPLESLEVADFRRAVEIDYLGTVHATLAALPHMRARGKGRIANITSIGGKVAVPHLLPYDAAKFAAVGFSEGLRAAVAADGITVTTVVPGLMRSGSPAHVEYRGRPERECTWFTLGDILPLSAMSAVDAADRIVLAIRRGEAEVVLTWQAKLLRAVHDLAPGTTSRLMGLMDRALPGPGDHDSAPGRELRGTLPAPIERALDRAGERSNQHPDPD